MDDLMSELNAALEAAEGGEPQGTPEPAPEPASQPEAAEPVAGDEPSGTPESDEPEEPSLLQELRQRYDPALVDEVYRYTDAQLKSGLTPKLQKLSELEKTYEGVEAADADFLRQLYQAPDDRTRAEMLRQAAQFFEGPQVAGQPPAPAQPVPEAAEPEFATDVERDLWYKAQQLEQRLAQQDAWRQQEIEARNRAEVDAKFERLGKEVGRPIPLEEQQQIARECMKRAKQGFDRNGNQIWLMPEVDEMWKVLNFDKVRQTARDEAATVVQRKAAITPAPAPTTRPTPPPKEAETLEELLLPIYNARG